MSAPTRMCMVCRQRKPKSELTRIVKNTSGVKLDFTGKADGRGAYICKRLECQEKLVKTKALNRSFHENIDVETYNKILEEIKK